MSKFADVVVKKIKGEAADLLAAKIEKKAKSALLSQVASLQSKKVDLEDKLDTAEAELEAAIYPEVMIISSERYAESIKFAQGKVDTAEDAIEAVEESIEYYEKVIAEKF